MGRPVSLKFVGREGELDRLRTALEAAAAGRPSIVLVGGEAGVGKTRLVRELAESSVDVARTLYGRCVPVADGELPFAPFVEAFRRLPAEAAPAHLALSAAFGDPDADLLPAPAGVVPIAGWTAQSRLFELVLEQVGRLSSDRVLLLVLEDLHWADRSSRELLLFLARNLESEALLLVATYRSDELHRRHPLLATLSELGRLPAVDRVDVGRLEPTRVAELLGSMGAADLPAEVIDQIAARSEGVPFHAEELVAAARQGRLSMLTPSLRETLTVRLAALPTETLRLVRTAAAIGRQADHRLLASVASLDDLAFVEAVRPAIDHHILDAIEAAGGVTSTYEFRHALLAEAAYEELLPAERASLHRAIATELEDTPADATTTEALRKAEIGYHWDRAHDPERALSSAVEAGLAADRADAPAEALAQYRRALDRWPLVGRANELTGLEEWDLLGRAARAARTSGDLAGAARLAMAALEQASPIASVDQRVGLLELRHLCLWDLGDPAGARAALEEGLELATRDTDPGPRARVLSYKAWRAFLEDRFDEARATSEEAVALARGTGEAAAEHLALFSLGSVLIVAGEVARAERLLRRVASDGDLAEIAVAMSRVRLAELLVEAGRPIEAAADYRALRHDVRERGLRGAYDLRLASSLAEALMAAGEWAHADAVLDAAVSIGDSRLAVWPYMYRAWLRVCQGRLAGAREALSAAAGLVSPLHNERVALLFVRAVLAQAEARFDDGRLAVAEIVEVTEDLRYDTIPFAMVAGMRLEADRAVDASARRRHGVVAESRRVGAGYADLMTRAIDAAGARGRMPKLVALATHVAAERTRLDGVPDPAAFDAAARDYELAGRPFDAAGCLFRAAETSLEAGGPRAAAGDRLRAALQTATALGAAGLERDVIELARRSRIDLEDVAPVQSPEVPRAPVPADPYGLTPREHQVLVLLAAGHSNRRIAERLFIAESTAGVHVSNVIGKLGVQGRGGAAAVGVRLGLVPDPESEDALTSE